MAPKISDLLDNSEFLKKLDNHGLLGLAFLYIFEKINLPNYTSEKYTTQYDVELRKYLKTIKEEAYNMEKFRSKLVSNYADGDKFHENIIYVWDKLVPIISNFANNLSYTPVSITQVFPGIIESEKDPKKKRIYQFLEIKSLSPFPVKFRDRIKSTVADLKSNYSEDEYFRGEYKRITQLFNSNL